MHRIIRLFGAISLAFFITRLEAVSWPDMSIPARSVGGASNDAAVIVSVEKYAFVADVPGAIENGRNWYSYFNKTRGIPSERIFFLKNSDATAESMKEAADRVSKIVNKDGTLWYVFIGHGAPGRDGKDGLLVGVDAQQKMKNLEQRSLPQSDLMGSLVKSQAKKITVIVDACFSGRGRDGQELVSGLQPLVVAQLGVPKDDRVLLMSAAKGNEYAGALPGGRKPAFSYLVLGALRGWADHNKDRLITAGEIRSYVNEIFQVTLYNRIQTPDIFGDEDIVLGSSPGENGPNLGEIVKANEEDEGFEFEVSRLPPLPEAKVPVLAGFSQVRVEMPSGIGQKPVGVDFGKVNIEELEKYDQIVQLDKSDVDPAVKESRWRAFGDQYPAYSKLAEKRAQEWKRFADQQLIEKAILNESNMGIAPEDKAEEWRRIAKRVEGYKDEANERAKSWDQFAAELAAFQKAKKERDEMRARDFKKLQRIIGLSIISIDDKKKWVQSFLATYEVIDAKHIQGLFGFLPEDYLSVEAVKEILKEPLYVNDEQFLRAIVPLIPANEEVEIRIGKKTYIGYVVFHKYFSVPDKDWLDLGGSMWSKTRLRLKDIDSIQLTGSNNKQKPRQDDTDRWLELERETRGY